MSFIELSNGVSILKESVEAVTLENNMTVVYTHHNRYETAIPKYLVIEMIEGNSPGLGEQHFAG